jgi:hypothetical protein
MADNANSTDYGNEERGQPPRASLKRFERFDTGFEPHEHDDSVRLKSETTAGPFHFLNPTRADFESPFSVAKAQQKTSGEQDRATKEATEEGSQPDSNTESSSEHANIQWRSRDNRKGRHQLVIRKPAEQSQKAGFKTPEVTSTFHQTAIGLWRMLTIYAIWDVSYLVAVIFTLGSVVWCINACFVFLPFIKPSSEFPNEITVGGGWTAWIGATIFEGGSWLLMLEAINENRGGCFGWALERAVYGRTDDNESDDENGKSNENGKDEKGFRIVPDRHHCSHHHANKGNLVGKPRESSFERAARAEQRREMSQHAPPIKGTVSEGTGKTWQWYPSLLDLKNHYMREIGFLACLAQLIGATIFWIAGFTAIPQLVPGSQGLLEGIYWAPQVIGGTGFIVSGILFMLETQKNWYTPAFGTLGWHIAFWNLIGGIGFTLSGAFGTSTSSWAEYQAGCSTFWGSWAFLIGSVIQWYESLSKYPVEKNLGRGGN